MPLVTSDCGDLSSKSPWRRVGAICVQLYTAGEEREASRILKFRQLDCDYCLRRDADFLTHFHLDLRLESEVFQKYCQTELPEGEGRSNRPSIIQSFLVCIK